MVARTLLWGCRLLRCCGLLLEHCYVDAKGFWFVARALLCCYRVVSRALLYGCCCVLEGCLTMFRWLIRCSGWLPGRCYVVFKVFWVVVRAYMGSGLLLGHF